VKIALIGNSKGRFESVYDSRAMSRLATLGECSPLLGKGDFAKNEEFLRGCEYAFSTWGMPVLSREELERWLPNLKACFYAAGSVQDFARPLLSRGVRLSCAAAANAIPVGEFTFSQICLAAKGAFAAQKYYRLFRAASYKASRGAPGNYKIKVGLLGVGAVGALVAERLKTVDAEVLAYDPFLPREQAEELGVRLVALENIFTDGDIISNHLANKPEHAALQAALKARLDAARKAAGDEFLPEKNYLERFNIAPEKLREPGEKSARKKTSAKKSPEKKKR